VANEGVELSTGTVEPRGFVEGGIAIGDWGNGRAMPVCVAGIGFVGIEDKTEKEGGLRPRDWDGGGLLCAGSEPPNGIGSDG